MVTFAEAIEILILLMAISLAICFIRLFNGPNVPNRTVAFDTIAVHAVGILTLYAILEQSPYLLTVAFVTAVLGFLGTTMMARYLERSEEEGWHAEQVERPFNSRD
ncbi:MAG: monovalent cation/H+ antiporter complex subunit F [Caldilineaceae bacterium]|jgi:multisubunit Na+/H+ antiporter MnhF subunit